MISGRPADESNGYTRSFDRRPEYETFGALIAEVVDATTLTEYPADDLRAICIRELFQTDREIFVGFGKPNCYLVCPDGEGGYQKFAGKSLRLEPSKIAKVKERVQSGILLRLNNLPPEAAERLREAMQHFDGQRFWTCVNACMRVMQRAGFTSGSRPLSRRYWPYSLFKSLTKDGLMYKGQPVEFEIIRTTPMDLSTYGREVLKAELTTLCRHADRKLMLKGRKSKFVNAVYKGLHAPAKLLQRTRAPQVVRVVSSRLPHGLHGESDIRIRVSKASLLGWFLRLFWGAHLIFEARTDRMQPSAFFSRTLIPFPQKNPSLVTRLKKTFLFAPWVIACIRLILCPHWEQLPGTKSERDVHDMLRTHTAEAPEKYNLVITSDCIIVARISVGSRWIDRLTSWILSKHVVLSGYQDSFFAGETYKDLAGVIHVTDGSGTYQPTNEELAAAAACLQAAFPHLTVVADEPFASPSNKED